MIGSPALLAVGVSASVGSTVDVNTTNSNWTHHLTVSDPNRLGFIRKIHYPSVPVLYSVHAVLTSRFKPIFTFVVP